MTKIEKDGVTVEFVDVTPELAVEWLEANTHNRNLRYRVVGSYATDLAANDWDLNGETIKFAKDGTLLDGQHRLEAIVEAEVTVSCLVVRGLDPETQATMDRGVTRKFSDILKLGKEPNYVSLAAITRAVTLWEKGFRRHTSNYTPSAKQLQHTLDKFPNLRDYSIRATAVAAKSGIPASVLGLAMHVLYQIEPGDAEWFFDRIASGAGLEPGNPVYELRKRVSEVRSNRGKSNVYLMTAYTFKAWNAFREGRELRPLVFRAGGPSPEAFPEPV